ncbi:Restriction endonuclease [Trichlorobacter thiogenes]|uniref:Restriction endonuclease n=1 Tax=Trichlorobacter thiogenes TaxID=115783 RepID=A0A1T4PQS0_9BACT|nr:restriction endonuclease [Trichlorobacter thiogenes]SJZ93759.1 Restriction endonuclease [Trichlorobacter thiogenes]
MSIPWKEYQEEAASLFRSLGLDANTDITVKGVRTNHDIDVLVKSQHVGFEITWLVECKYWKTRVSKLHVLALREIVSDVGADRGIILSEAGFQSGAIEAAHLTNVQVTSLAEISTSARNDIFSMRLRELFDRIEDCNDRYWNIPKKMRIEYGLRPDVGAIGYSGNHMIDLCRDLLSRAFRGVYPFNTEAIMALLIPSFQTVFNSPNEVVDAVEPLVSELEQKLVAYEAGNQA